MKERMRLDDVLAKMRLLGDPDGDHEINHGEADSLLIELAKSLADESNRKTVDAIIDAYEAVPKWYA